VERCEINRTTDEYAKQRITIRMTNARYSADPGVGHRGSSERGMQVPLSARF
jgi:hypothetical protein